MIKSMSCPAGNKKRESEIMEGAYERTAGASLVRFEFVVGMEFFSGNSLSKKYLRSWTVSECIPCATSSGNLSI